MLAGFGRAIVNASYERPLEGAVEEFREGIWTNFLKKQGPSGAPWADRVDNLPHPLLFKTGAMLEAAIGEGAGAITEIGPEEALTGIDDAVIDYAKYHMTGTRKMPARPYHYAGDDTLQRMNDRVASESMSLLL